MNISKIKSYVIYVQHFDFYTQAFFFLKFLNTVKQPQRGREKKKQKMRKRSRVVAGDRKLATVTMEEGG